MQIAPIVSGYAATLKLIVLDNETDFNIIATLIKNIEPQLCLDIFNKIVEWQDELCDFKTCEEVVTQLTKWFNKKEDNA